MADRFVLFVYLQKLNAKWLKIQQMAEDEMSKAERPSQNQERQLVRHLSRRGMYPSISFMNFDELPALFRQEPPVPWREVNPDYGKYRDPLTGKPYNSVEEFKQIRKKHFAELEKKGGVLRA